MKEALYKKYTITEGQKEHGHFQFDVWIFLWIHTLLYFYFKKKSKSKVKYGFLFCLLLVIKGKKRKNGHTAGGLVSGFDVGIRGVEADRANLSAWVSVFLGSGTVLELVVFLRPVLQAGTSSSCFLSCLGACLGGGSLTCAC